MRGGRNNLSAIPIVRPSATRCAPRLRPHDAAAAAFSAQLDESLAENQEALVAERQAHAATQARLEAGRVELEAAGRQLQELRTQFSTERRWSGCRQH